MKTLAIILLAVALSVAITPVCAQEPPVQLPNDGNELLENCGQMVSLMDSPSFSANSWKVGWCIGYATATITVLQGIQIAMNEKFSDFERMTKGPLGICLPLRATPAQIARVMVKWLRDHPERLHENASGLTFSILREAFPCHADDTTKKPATK